MAVENETQMVLRIKKNIKLNSFLFETPSAPLRTKPHLLPNLLPFFTPCERPTAGNAGFTGKICFFHVFRHEVNVGHL
jgi:hypothetical protein